MAVRSPPSVFKEMRPMDATMIDEHLENIDRRLTTLEQILPTLATKDELKTLATKDELKILATKNELKALATKDQLKTLATKAELQAAIAPLATKVELRKEGERLRRHMTVLFEHQDSKIQLLAEHVLSLMPKQPEP
jgi:hypothetical protein